MTAVNPNPSRAERVAQAVAAFLAVAFLAPVVVVVAPFAVAWFVYHEEE